jgi:Putative prokaryotic signal transducing protein
VAVVVKLVAVYKASSAVEAHCVGQILDEAGIECRIEGGHLESIYGIGTSWTMLNILVSEDDVQQARQLIADQLAASKADSPPKRPVRYGMKSLLVNVTLIAIIFGFYRSLGAQWPRFALSGFLYLFLGNVLIFAYLYKKRRSLADEHDAIP